MRIILVGYRATGKTTLAKTLGDELSLECLDADVVLEDKEGFSIAKIFSEKGESYFRELETAVLKELLQKEKIVLALGGGVVVRPENRELLKGQNGTVVWLTATPKTIAQRLSQDAKTEAQRPSLTDKEPLDEVKTLLAQREPWYREVADFSVSTEGKTVPMLAREIIDRL
ncbi:MAG: shikimate kinase [Pirellulaceae bacterium]|nr:shikimate kinase [Pirellulaceae bacterium]